MTDDDAADEACYSCGQICGGDICFECAVVIHQAQLDIAEAEALGHRCADEHVDWCEGLRHRVLAMVFDWPENHHQTLRGAEGYQDMKDDR